MSNSKPSMDSFSDETTPICQNGLSTDGGSRPVTFAEYLSLQEYPCPNMIQIDQECSFVCGVCGKAFHAARNLGMHMKIHNKDQHQCPHCPDKFAMQFRLIEHIRTHTGEKPFLCHVCSKVFHAARNLAVHMKTHNKEKQCPHCPGKFAQQSRLNDHIRAHTGETPFMCTVCDKAFHAAGNLRIHMKMHNKDQH